MTLTLSNLPPGITDSDIRALLKNDSRIRHVRFNDSGSPDKVMVFVELDVDRFEAAYIADHLNRTFVAGHRIQAYAPLFMR